MGVKLTATLLSLMSSMVGTNLAGRRLSRKMNLGVHVLASQEHRSSGYHALPICSVKKPQVSRKESSGGLEFESPPLRAVSDRVDLMNLYIWCGMVPGSWLLR